VDEATEAQLVAALRRGDAAAFDEAYARHRDRVFNFLYRLCGRRDLAEDLFQETFLKLARHALRLDEDTDLGAWLYTVARNHWRSHQRWSLVDAQRVFGLAREPRPDPHPESRSVARDEIERLERALARLPPASREVIVMVAIEGIAQDRAAQLLAIAPDALRQRLSRARAQLAKALEDPSPAALAGGLR
jgi:RNA polymerase sigma-70 factor (ECF subfamily)